MHLFDLSKIGMDAAHIVTVLAVELYDGKEQRDG
jgi:hypothetical protein